MSIQTYSVDRFIGLNQSGDENLMSPACTPDAANMCTDGGELRVAYGFTRLFEAAVPGTLRIDFFTLYRTNGAEIPVVIAGGVVYAYIENAWTPVYTYQSTRSKPIYDCAQVRINTTDYLVTADWRNDPAHPFHLTTANLGGLLVFRCKSCQSTVRQKHFRDHMAVECTPYNPD